MTILDVFSGNAFNSLSLTTAMNKLPYKPGRLGAMGLFRRVPITGLAAVIEEQQGKLALVPNLPRGVQTTLNPRGVRNIRTIRTAHLPLNDAILADDVQGVRAFGSESEVQSVAEIVNERLMSMRQNLEVTTEYHRIGAIRGIVLDADGTTEILDLFDEFGITEEVVTFIFGTDDMKTKAMEVITVIEENLGATPYEHIHAIAGAAFYADLIGDPTVKTAFELQNSNAFAREQQRRGFVFGDITWEPYRGKIGSVDFIPADQARFFPVGVPDLFQEIYAPANFVETVNTPGKPVYAKQERMEFDLGVKLHSQSNPLTICTRPGILVQGATG